MANGDEIRIRDQRSPGWFWCQNELLDEYGPRLGAYGVAVYCVLVRNSRNDVAAIWMTAVAKTLNCSRRKVFDAIDVLVALGLIQKETGAASGVANTYSLCDLKPAQEGAHQVRTHEQMAVGGVHQVHRRCAPHGIGGVHQVHGGCAPGAQKKTDCKTQDSKTSACASPGAAPAPAPAPGPELFPAIPSKSRQRSFQPPSLAEVAAYCQERGKGVNPERWRDYYLSNGWRVGRNSMKDWRAAVRTWERNGAQDGTGYGKGRSNDRAARLREVFERVRAEAD